jgi:hypothetical protein
MTLLRPSNFILCIVCCVGTIVFTMNAPAQSTIGVVPGGELGNIPEPQLHNTFDKYFAYFQERKTIVRELPATILREF